MTQTSYHRRNTRETYRLMMGSLTENVMAEEWRISLRSHARYLEEPIVREVERSKATSAEYYMISKFT